MSYWKWLWNKHKEDVMFVGLILGMAGLVLGTIVLIGIFPEIVVTGCGIIFIVMLVIFGRKSHRDYKKEVKNIVVSTQEA